YRCLFFAMIASGLTVAIFPWVDLYVGAFALRWLSGVAGALSLVPLETFVNSQSPPDHRGRNFGYYAFCIALGMALGTLGGMELYPFMPRTAFVLGGLTPLLGSAIVLAWKPDFAAAPTIRLNANPTVHVARSNISMFRNFLSFGSALSQGFLEGAM